LKACFPEIEIGKHMGNKAPDCRPEGSRGRIPPIDAFVSPFAPPQYRPPSFADFLGKRASQEVRGRAPCQLGREHGNCRRAAQWSSLRTARAAGSRPGNLGFCGLRGLTPLFSRCRSKTARSFGVF
jgi:hypothetical protein